MNPKSHLHSLFLSLCGFISLLASPLASAALNVTNGDFSDLTDLTPQGGDWYQGVPAGWTSTAGNPGYAVDANAGRPSSPVANVATLSTLRQNLGTTASASLVTLTFDIGTFGAAPSVTVRITDGASVVYASANYSTGNAQTLSAYTNAGSPVYVEFANSGVENPWLDNVSVTDMPGGPALANGNFSDLTGLTAEGGPWYSGVPTGWFLSSGGTPGYSVVQNGAAYYANLQTLSNGSPNLRQNIGTLSTAADITVTFKTRSLTSIPGSVGSAIYNAADDSPLAVFSTPSRITGDTSVTYTARGVAAGTAVYVSFWSFVPEAAPGITDVAVSVAAAPTTLTLHSDSVTQLDAALPIRTNYQMVFEPGAKASVTGSAIGDAVLLLASTASISGTPVLDPPVTGYSLATTGKRLWLYAAGSPSLAVFNGDFSNLSGLTDNGGGWYGGVPADWSSPYTNPAYTVTGTTANLQTLSYTSNPFYQNVGTTDSVTTITLSFEVLQLQTNTPTVTVAIYDSTVAPFLTSPLATGTYSVGSHSLVATDVPANTPITLAFSENTVTDSAGGLDNVSVAVTAAGATFSGWQSANGTTGALDDDHDDDGVTNGIEYFLGGSTLPDANTTGFTGLPSVTPGSPLTVTWTKAASYTGNYDTHFRVETSETLSGAWSPVSEGVGTDTVQISDNNITYTFPAGPAKKFARLVVTGP